MYRRAAPVSRRLASKTVRPSTLNVTRRRLATEAAASPSVQPIKKKNVLRRLIVLTTAATGTFYVGSTFVAFNNASYYEFFSDNVPLGHPMLEYAEANKWDKLTVEDVIEASKNAVITVQKVSSDLIDKTPGAREALDNAKASAFGKKVEEATETTVKAVKDGKEKLGKIVDPVVKQVKAEAKENVKAASKVVERVEKRVKEAEQKVEDELALLIKKAEAAIAGNLPSEVEKAADPASAPVVVVLVEETEESSKNVYSAPLPLGFEPPPGYVRPSPPKPKKVEEPSKEGAAAPAAEVILPLVAPAISSLDVQEPIITHLAGTIDNLASFLKSNPSAATQATDVLDTAKADLASLVERIEKVKEEERAVLEAKLDEQVHEHNLKLLELEMAAQDKLDNQEEGFRKFFEQERIKFLEAYRAKLDHELKTQTELINERLKEEVIAQGIELQRRWIREIKVRVEQERGGRLAKLDELAADLKRLERLTLDNTNYLDENIRVHSLWSAVRALTGRALSTPQRQPFRDELRVLRHVSAAKEDEVISAALNTLEASDAPDIGVEPFSDLASWFATSVAPKVSEVALVPDQNAGVLSYLASKVLSGVRFKKQGLVEGDDVLSVLSRAEYHLNEKDLDSAARELNQLKGPAKVLLHDWLEAARRRLEVQQALDVIQTEAALSSLLVV
ncbi:hypothetical protein EST38_g8028 [Candolleomyces aberdarensis]|uniref:MICOS complex subunit MIC60 n=1 Tax=Candolleomyces aberdarensis TaxID=2316362 RepID=A0A4Q2DFQ1_9AGAR|nr:hypothetical protein EST38_g8028 [Candolleomyces aberdarensis]